MSLKCDTIIEVTEGIRELLDNKDLQYKLINNQMQNISKDTCDKIIEVVLKDKGNL